MGSSVLGNLKGDSDIKKYFDFLNHTDYTEIRVIVPKWEPNKTEPLSFFVKDSKKFEEIVKKYDGKFDIYAGINTRKEKKKSDSDVPYITNIGHDIDCHDSGEKGLIKAGEVALLILKECQELGFQEPLIMNSGYGYWVIHHVSPIENTSKNVKKIKEFGKKIKKKYEVEGVEIDTTVYNPSRIGRVPGTLNLRKKDKPIKSFLVNNPKGFEDAKLTREILNLELPKHTPVIQSSHSQPTINSFMDYCLTHEIPKGERHKVISRHIALYIADHPDRETLKEQYVKIQKGAEGELDGYLKKIDEEGKDKFPFSIGELVNFTKKYKIPFDWKLTPEYQQWLKEKKAERNLQKEIRTEKRAEEIGKIIKFFYNMKDLAKQLLKVQPLYYDKSKLWWAWNKEIFCWELCDEVDIMNYLSKNSEADTINSKTRSEILEALRQESRLNPPEPINNKWIQFKNKIFDLKKGNIFEATPSYFVTNPIPWELSDNEETPVIDKIFEEWVGTENVQTLYEIIAYCLLPSYPIHRIFCFIGDGLNGKSKFLQLLKKFVGENNCCATELDILLASRFEVTRLHNKLVCQMGETNFEELNRTSLLKKLSGEDMVGYEYKRKTPFEGINYAKILISTNNLPNTTDKTIGFYRRWMIIDFPNKFSEKIEILDQIPEQEYINLTRKSIKILRKLLKDREFTNEGSIEERIVKYEEKSDFLTKFIEEFTIEDFEEYITVSEFNRRFKAWCKENRHREMSEISIGKSMKKRGMEQNKKYFDWMHDGRGGQARVWAGLKWKI